MRASPRPAIALVGLALGGCVFHRLSSDIEQIKQTGFLQGRVLVAEPDAGSVYVAQAVLADGGLELVACERLPPGVVEYAFFVGAGQPNEIVAFQDENGDGVWGPGDPVGQLDAPVVVEARRQVSVPDIRLAAGSAPPPLSLNARDMALARRPDLVVGDVTSLDNPAFAPEQSSLGMWQPLEAARTLRFGVYFLEPYDPARIPVLFVHGIEGSPRDFRDAIAALDKSKYQAWVVHYPSGIRLPIVAHVLRNLLVSLQERLGFPKLVVTAHSMGGLVARAALLELARDGKAGFIQTLVTFSTPYGGHGLAAAGLAHAPTAVPSWIDMAPGSSFLASLVEPLPRTLPFYLLFGYGERGMLPGGSNDGVVTVASELAPYAQDGAAAVFGFVADHVGILSDSRALKRWGALLDGCGGR